MPLTPLSARHERPGLDQLCVLLVSETLADHCRTVVVPVSGTKQHAQATHIGMDSPELYWALSRVPNGQGLAFSLSVVEATFVAVANSSTNNGQLAPGVKAPHTSSSPTLLHPWVSAQCTLRCDGNMTLTGSRFADGSSWKIGRGATLTLRAFDTIVIGDPNDEGRHCVLRLCPLRRVATGTAATTGASQVSSEQQTGDAVSRTLRPPSAATMYHPRAPLLNDAVCGGVLTSSQLSAIILFDVTMVLRHTVDASTSMTPRPKRAVLAQLTQSQPSHVSDSDAEKCCSSSQNAAKARVGRHLSANHHTATTTAPDGDVTDSSTKKRPRGDSEAAVVSSQWVLPPLNNHAPIHASRRVNIDDEGLADEITIEEDAKRRDGSVDDVVVVAASRESLYPIAPRSAPESLDERWDQQLVALEAMSAAAVVAAAPPAVSSPTSHARAAAKLGVALPNSEPVYARRHGPFTTRVVTCESQFVCFEHSQE